LELLKCFISYLSTLAFIKNLESLIFYLHFFGFFLAKYTNYLNDKSISSISLPQLIYYSADTQSKAAGKVADAIKSALYYEKERLKFK
jgi:hypothetical protein